MAKTQPFSIRLTPATAGLVAEEVRRSGRSRGAVVEELAEEAAKARLFPGIAFRGPAPRRAWVIGTGLDVWEIIAMQRDYGNDRAKLLRNHPALSDRALSTALAYTSRFPDEVEPLIQAARRSPEELRELYPFIAFEGTGE
ncbi:MAG: ribbon-helix-helix protein, CopG family [Thermoleophilia bacterium]|nr:ribbon-helix-helix protein, CopG family [Thermoleophilia bacterium]